MRIARHHGSRAAHAPTREGPLQGRTRMRRPRPSGVTAGTQAAVSRESGAPANARPRKLG